MMEFAGWEMPRDFDGILAEHRAVRSRAGVFDVSHMGRLQVRGAKAGRALDRLFTRNLDGVEPGTALYGFFCDGSGGCLDDAITYVRSPEEYWIVVNAANRTTILDHFDTHHLPSEALRDRTDRTVLLAVQGPEAPSILADEMGRSLPDGRYRCRWENETMVATTGYTGEPGAELWLPESTGRAVYRDLLESVVPCGLGARDTLRLEKAYPLHGHELSRSIDPVTAGLDRFVDFDHSFLGRDALEERRSSPEQTLIGLRFRDRRRADRGAEVRWEDEVVGRVTSSGYSPTLEVALALARVQVEAADRETLSVARNSSELEVQVVHGPFV